MTSVHSKNKMPIALVALLLSTFAIGTTEFVIMGILPDVANDLGVSISAAGLLVTGYALGVAVGAPILTALTGGLSRKTLLLRLMILFVIGNTMCALAPNYTFLMIARVISAFAHGTFFGVGSVVASKLVSPDKKASAVAVIFTGVSLANIVGVPLGTFVGQHLGWRASFGIVSSLGTISILGIALLIPNISNKTTASFRQEIRILRKPQVLLTLLMTILSFVGVFAAKLSDWKLMPSLVGMLSLLTIVMGLFSITSHDKLATIITVFIWGFASFGHVPGFQTRIIEKAKGAPNLASSLNISAFNLGIAGGAYLGGLVIDNGFGLDAVPWVASLLTTLCILVTIIGWMLDRHSELPILSSRKA